MNKKYPGINIDLNKLSKTSKIFVELPVSIDSNTDWKLSAKIGAYTYFRGGRVAGLKEIGRFCSVAPDVVIGDGEHPITYMSSHPFQWEGSNVFKTDEEYKNYKAKNPKLNLSGKEKITIGNDVWIGSGARILRGVTIGDGAIIAAGAVVAKDVEPYSIVGGVPAKHIKFRFSEEVIEKLLDLKWWDYTLSSMSGIDFENVEDAIKEMEERKSKGLLKIFKPKKITITNEGSLKQEESREEEKPFELIMGEGSAISPTYKEDISGEGHRIILGEKTKIGNIKVIIRGKNNTISFGDNTTVKAGLYVIKGENQHIKIGNKTSIENTYFLSGEGANIDVGDGCMFSYDINIRTTDAHSIFSEKTGDRVNISESVKIGDNIWVGTGVMVMKGVSIADGNIIGARSLVTKNIEKEKSIYAGTPARFIKEGFVWHKDLKDHVTDTTNRNYRQAKKQ